MKLISNDNKNSSAVTRINNFFNTDSSQNISYFLWVNKVKLSKRIILKICALMFNITSASLEITSLFSHCSFSSTDGTNTMLNCNLNWR